MPAQLTRVYNVNQRMPETVPHGKEEGTYPLESTKRSRLYHLLFFEFRFMNLQRRMNDYQLRAGAADGLWSLSTDDFLDRGPQSVNYSPGEQNMSSGCKPHRSTYQPKSK
jgi:hypothetical protein